MLKLYKMPNGHKYWFEDDRAPESAVLFEPEEKAAEPAENKAVKPANKARKKVANK